MERRRFTREFEVVAVKQAARDLAVVGAIHSERIMKGDRKVLHLLA